MIVVNSSRYLYGELVRQAIFTNDKLNKKVMKSTKYVILTIIAFSGFSNSLIANNTLTATADTTMQVVHNFELLERSLLYGLSSDVNGVVESALFNAVNYKVVYPEFSSERLVETLNKIALEGNTHTLRYKAFLTLAYFRDQYKFESPSKLAELIDLRDQNRIFYYLQDEIQTAQFTSNQ